MVRAFTCEPFGRVKIILPEILTLFIRANTLKIKDINKAKIIKIKIFFFIFSSFLPGSHRANQLTADRTFPDVRRERASSVHPVILRGVPFAFKVFGSVS